MEESSSADTVSEVPQALVNPQREVPALAGPSQGVPLAEMNDEQSLFYENHFRPAFLAGTPIDVGQESGYVRAMGIELASEINSDPDAPKEIRRLLRAYGRPWWEIADTYFLDGDFASGYAVWGRRVPFGLYVNLAPSLGHPRISALTVLYWAGNHLTRRGIRGFEDVMDRL